MKCPLESCKGELYFTQSLESTFKKKHKVLNYFCPLCGWMKLFKIEITKKEFKKEEEEESKIYKL